MTEVAMRPPASESEALLDVSVRFLWNTNKEIPTVSRLFFQLQQAHWYYEDFYVTEDGPCGHLPNAVFIRRMFEECPLLSSLRHQYTDLLAQFKEYVSKIPVYGAICLSQRMDKVLFIRSWGGKSWGFPKGKINEKESESEAAVRETEEEIGYNIRDKIREEDYISWKSGDQAVKLYIVRGVPDDGSVFFAPKCRKEVSEIGWFATASLPNDRAPEGSKAGKCPRQMFWSVLPALPQLLEWIASRRREERRGGEGRPPTGGKPTSYASAVSGAGKSSAPTTPVAPGKGKKGKGKIVVSTPVLASPALPSAILSRPPRTPVASTAGRAAAPAAGDVFAPLEDVVSFVRGGEGRGEERRGEGKAADGRGGKWSVADMFATNEAILQKKFTYDGNPHTFGDYAKYGAVNTDGGASTPTAATPASKRGSPAAAATTDRKKGGKGANKASIAAEPVLPKSASKSKPPASKSASAPASPALDSTPAPSVPSTGPSPFRFDYHAIMSAMFPSPPIAT